MPGGARCSAGISPATLLSPRTAARCLSPSRRHRTTARGWRNAAITRWEASHGVGSAWGNETDRAAVLVFDPEGRNRRVFASGLRNCVGLAVHPLTGDLWCSTNERDDLGDDLVP